MKQARILAYAASAALMSAGAAQAGTLWIANLSGAQEVPATNVPFTGRGAVVLNDAETRATVYATHDVVGADAGHIHRAPAGSNGPIIFHFHNPASPVGPLVWDIPAADLASLKANGLYFNFHTPTNRTGAIRGQISQFSFAPAAANASQAGVAAALNVSVQP